MEQGDGVGEVLIRLENSLNTNASDHERSFLRTYGFEQPVTFGLLIQMPMARFLALVSGILVLAPYILAQTPSILWQHALGGSELEFILQMSKTADGGSVHVGLSYSNDGDCVGNHDPDLSDVWVVKLDDAGTIEWQRMLGGTSEDWGYSIAQTSDGGYIVGGFAGSEDGDVSGSHGWQDGWIVKLFADGSTDWQKALGGSGFDGGVLVAQTSDGGYVVTMPSNSSDGDVLVNLGSFDVWVARLDATGVILWQHSYGGSGDDQPSSISLTSDDGVVIAGRSDSQDGDVTGNHGGADAWVLRLAPNGDVVWQRSLGGSDHEQGSSAHVCMDGGYIVAAATLSTDGDVTDSNGQNDAWVVKLDATGALLWQTTLGGSDNDGLGGVLETPDQGFIAVGGTASSDGDVTSQHGVIDGWVVGLDAAGGIQWQQTFGGSGDDGFASVALLDDGDLVIAGTAEINDGDVTGVHGSIDGWVVRVHVSPLSIGGLEQEAFSVAPDPTSGMIIIALPPSWSSGVVSVVDALGQVVRTERMSGLRHVLDLSALPKGMYLISVASPEGRSGRRVVLE